MGDHSPVSAHRLLVRLLPALALLAVLTLGTAAPSAAAPVHATAAASVQSGAAGISLPAADPAGAPAVSPDDADDHDEDFGWGPSRVVWGAFGWLGVVLLAAILLRRLATRRR